MDPNSSENLPTISEKVGRSSGGPSQQCLTKLYLNNRHSSVKFNKVNIITVKELQNKGHTSFLSFVKRLSSFEGCFFVFCMECTSLSSFGVSFIRASSVSEFLATYTS